MFVPEQRIIENGPRLFGPTSVHSANLPKAHKHTPAVSRVCAGQNLKSSMNTEADRPIIRCTLRSASAPLKGSRCENPVAFTQASAMTWPNNKRHSLHTESRWTELSTSCCQSVLSGGFSHFKPQKMWCSVGVLVKSWNVSAFFPNGNQILTSLYLHCLWYAAVETSWCYVKLLQFHRRSITLFCLHFSLHFI